jgi:hypothetical protein
MARDRDECRQKALADLGNARQEMLRIQIACIQGTATDDAIMRANDRLSVAIDEWQQFEAVGHFPVRV